MESKFKIELNCKKMDVTQAQPIEINDESLPDSKRRKVIQYCNKLNDELTNSVNLNLNEYHTNRTLDQMPDLVIEKILEFLPKNDLGRISVTCHKFQDAARKHFELKRLSGFITIDTKLRHPYVDFKEETNIYLVRFRSLIPHVIAIIRNDECVTNALRFIKNKCYKHLRTLVLTSNNFCFNDRTPPINITFMNMIAEQLNSLQNLVLDKNIRNNLQWNLFPKLRALSLATWTPEDQILFFRQTFPMLETLSLIDWKCNQDEFDHFLRNNAQLKNIFCNTTETIRCALSTKTKLSNVLIDFKYPAKIGNFADDLQECSNRKIINSLDISNRYMTEIELRQLARIENVRSLHFLWGNFKWPNNMDTLHHVKNLCLPLSGSETMTQQILNRIVKCFPNLEKLRLSIDGSMSTVSIEDMISFIIAGLSKLKILILTGAARREIRKPFIKEWDSVRSTVQSSNRLNIFFETKLSFFSNEYFKAKSISVTIKYCSLCALCNLPFSNAEKLFYLDNLSD